GEPGARRAKILTPIVGFAGGVMQGTTSISSPIVGSYFHALRLAPRDYVITLATVFQLSSTVQVLSYWALGLFTPELVTLGVIAGIALAGDAVELMKPEVQAKVRGIGIPPLADLVRSSIERGITFYI